MKLVSFFDVRTKRKYKINPEFVTAIEEEDCKAWGLTQITVVGNSGYHTFCISVKEELEIVSEMLTRA